MLKRRRTNLRRCETSTGGAAEIHDEEHEIYVDRTTQVVDPTIESEATQYAGAVGIRASLQVGEMSVVIIRSQLAWELVEITLCWMGMGCRREKRVMSGTESHYTRDDEQQLSDTLEVEPIETTGDIKLKVRGQLCDCGNGM